MTQAQVDARINAKTGPINTRIGDVDTRLGGRIDSVSQEVSRVGGRITAESNTRSREIGLLNGRINQNANRLTTIRTELNNMPTLINNVNSRVNAVEGIAVDARNKANNLQTVEIPALKSRQTVTESKTGLMNRTTIRSSTRDMSTGFSTIQQRFTTWKDSMALKRSASSNSASKANTHFNQAATDLQAWAASPITGIGRGVSSVAQIVSGIFDLAAAVNGLINLSLDLQTSYSEIATQFGLQSTRMSSLRNSF
jgi:methyl-accepting chemotaxis protein